LTGTSARLITPEELWAKMHRDNREFLRHHTSQEDKKNELPWFAKDEQGSGKHPSKRPKDG